MVHSVRPCNMKIRSWRRSFADFQGVALLALIVSVLCAGRIYGFRFLTIKKGRSNEVNRRASRPSYSLPLRREVSTVLSTLRSCMGKLSIRGAATSAVSALIDVLELSGNRLALLPAAETQGIVVNKMHDAGQTWASGCRSSPLRSVHRTPLS